MGSRAGGRRTGPKCIAIVGPFASGKTTLLEAILARTGAIPRQNPVSSGNTVSDHSPEAQSPRDERRGVRRHDRLHGREPDLRRLPRLRRVRLRGRRRACRLRYRGGGRRSRREENPRPAAHHAQARRSRRAAHPVPQQDRQVGSRRARHAEDAAAGKLGAAAACGRSRCARMALSSARSTSLWSAPTSGANTPRARSPKFPATRRRGKSRRASRCWKRSPTMTTS